ncbi:MAG: hypothetical protein RL328_2222 [Acidobacteriota bacterium]|jgi:hypothetical protein
MRLLLTLFGCSLVALGQEGAGKQLAGTPKPPPAKADTRPAPRWPDGRVNLGSTEEHKGYWEVRPGGGSRFPRAADIPMLPWARALATYRSSAAALYPPLVNCKPGSGPSFFNSPGFEIVDVPELKRVFLLNIAGAHSWRVIYTDGRQHPPKDKLRPTYLGHSIGHWEGDTLVVDTVGFNEKQWLFSTYPTTEQLHITEKFTRPYLTTMNYEITVDDPGAYSAPWSGGWTNTTWLDGSEMFEYICQNDRRVK